MASVSCAVRGCHNNWRKRNLSLSQNCFEHQTKRSECCGPLFTLHRPPSKDEDRRAWLKALDLKNPPKFPFVCSFHFVDGKPTSEHPYPEKWLGYATPLKKPRRWIVTHATASATCAVEDDHDTLEKETPSLPPDHDYARSSSPLKCDQATQCSGPPELNRQLLRSDHLSLLYTGLPLETFVFLADQLTKDYKNSFQMDARDQVFMSLMKLRLNLLQDDLAERFHASQSQVSKITSLWFDIMEEKLRSYIPWLPRETIQATMPQCFKDHYPTTTCIIDCSETSLQKPRDLDSRRGSDCHYYGQSTIKYLVAIAPCGLIMFVSATYGGRCSNRFITADSGFLENLRPGDVVMADRGFAVSDLLREQKVKLISTIKGTRLSEENITNTRHAADVRVHVERVVRRVKNFRVISQTVPINLAPKFDKILRICAALCNLRGEIIHEEEN